MATALERRGLRAVRGDIQAHALMLQNGAEKAFAELPLAVGQAVKKIRSTGLLWGLLQVAVALVIIGVVYFAGGLIPRRQERRSYQAIDIV